MIHLRVVVPPELTARALELLGGSQSVTNIIVLRGAALKPQGDVIFFDVIREEASDAISDLRELGVERHGSIAIGPPETDLSQFAASAERAASGHPADAVVWEEVEQHTSQSAKLSVSFLLFMIIAVLIAATGIYLNSSILIIGAMIVGPDFGPIAGMCVSAMDHQFSRTAKSLLALLTGYLFGIVAAYLLTLALREAGLIAQRFDPIAQAMAISITNFGFFAILIALLAGTAGMLSLTTAKPATLIGVLVSVTTIPAAANIAVTLAYSQEKMFRASLLQLATNVGAMLFAGIITLTIQRVLYRRRRAAHIRTLGRRGRGVRH